MGPRLFLNKLSQVFWGEKNITFPLQGSRESDVGNYIVAGKGD